MRKAGAGRDDRQPGDGHPLGLPVVDAARLMESADVGPLPVVDGGTPVGIVTDRDIAIRVVAQAKDPSRTTVGDIATGQPYYAGHRTRISARRSN